MVSSQLSSMAELLHELHLNRAGLQSRVNGISAVRASGDVAPNGVLNSDGSHKSPQGGPEHIEVL